MVNIGFNTIHDSKILQVVNIGFSTAHDHKILPITKLSINIFLAIVFPFRQLLKKTSVNLQIAGNANHCMSSSRDVSWYANEATLKRQNVCLLIIKEIFIIINIKC